MKSEAFVFLGLLFAVLLLVTSAVAEETTSKEVKKGELAYDKLYSSNTYTDSMCAYLYNYVWNRLMHASLSFIIL